MKSQGLDCTPSDVANLKGDAAKAAFITHFKEVQRLKTQLDQYTDLTEENKATIDAVLPEENLRGFKGQYLETAKKLKEQQGKTGGKDDTTDDPVDQIDFEFVLFASAVIDYDYIMSLIACYSAKGPGKSKMTREELIGLISADAKFIHERDDIATCLSSLDSLITAETQQLEALKTHKRGLIQQFFPAPTEQPHTIEGHHPGFPSPEEAEA